MTYEVVNGYKTWESFGSPSVMDSAEGRMFQVMVSEMPARLTSTSEGGWTGEVLDAGYSGAMILAATATASIAITTITLF